MLSWKSLLYTQMKTEQTTLACLKKGAKNSENKKQESISSQNIDQVRW